jgi:hypothetical protein
VYMDGSLYKFHPHFHNRMVTKVGRQSLWVWMGHYTLYKFHPPFHAFPTTVASLPHNCCGSCRPEPTGSQRKERTAMKIYEYPIRPGAGFRIQRLHRKILYNMPRGHKKNLSMTEWLRTKERIQIFYNLEFLFAHSRQNGQQVHRNSQCTLLEWGKKLQ